VTAYFGYHVFHGEHGVIAWQKLEHEAVSLADTHSQLEAQRQQLERQVSLLRPESLDPDSLDEHARGALGFAGENDILVFFPPSNP